MMGALDPERPTASWLLASLGVFVALAVVHTWPLASAPGLLSRNDVADTVLHEWILAWVAHQLVTDPLRLFDANIFYPERYTLAYSDHLIVQSVMGAPLTWAGFSPVLVHNVVLIAGYALTGWTTALVVARWTGSRAAGLLSGSLVAFNAFTLTRLPQIQDLHFEFFPLVLAGARSPSARSPRARCAGAGRLVRPAIAHRDLSDGLHRDFNRRGDAGQAARLARHAGSPRWRQKPRWRPLSRSQR